MRKACLNAVHELARHDTRVFFLGSDLGFETLADFREEIPEQFLMEGISEANAVGMAAGLALEGKIVYFNTIATFIVRRAYEQIAVDLCMHNIPVRLIGNGGGLVYAPLGSTHLAIEDISIMRALPNMTVVCPADADEMRRFVPLSLEYPGPIYIRLAKGYDPVISKAEFGFEIGRGIHFRSGTDVLIVTTGVTLQEAAAAADLLAEDGIEAGILHLHTVKPFDQQQFLDLAALSPVIVSVEENSILGGLGSAVAESLSEANFTTPKKFQRIGIPDEFPDYYGTQKEIMARFGINSTGIYRTIKKMQRETK